MNWTGVWDGRTPTLAHMGTICSIIILLGAMLTMPRIIRGARHPWHVILANIGVTTMCAAGIAGAITLTLMLTIVPSTDTQVGRTVGVTSMRCDKPTITEGVHECEWADTGMVPHRGMLTTDGRTWRLTETNATNQ